MRLFQIFVVLLVINLFLVSCSNYEYLEETKDNELICPGFVTERQVNTIVSSMEHSIK